MTFFLGGGAWLCSVESRNPSTQDPRNEIMNLRVNQFSLFLSPVLHYTGPETGLVEDALVWSSEQFTLPKFGLGLVAKLCFGEYSGATKRFRADSVCCICVPGSPFIYCYGTEIYFFCTTKQARSIWTYFVSKMFHDCIIFNFGVY